MPRETVPLGRPPKSPKEKGVQKSINLLQSEWECLAEQDQDGSPTRAAARILRAYVKDIEKGEKEA